MIRRRNAGRVNPDQNAGRLESVQNLGGERRHPDPDKRPALPGVVSYYKRAPGDSRAILDRLVDCPHTDPQKDPNTLRI